MDPTFQHHKLLLRQMSNSTEEDAVSAALKEAEEEADSKPQAVSKKKKKKRSLDDSTAATESQTKVAKRTTMATPDNRQQWLSLRPSSEGPVPLAAPPPRHLLEQLLQAQPPPLPFHPQRNMALPSAWRAEDPLFSSHAQLQFDPLTLATARRLAAAPALNAALQQSRQDLLIQELLLAQSRAALPRWSPEVLLLSQQLEQGRALAQLLETSTPRPAVVETTVPMEAASDVDHLSKYQVLIRKQLEFFVSQEEDATYSVQGRKKQIHLGQVGIRCRHCSHLPHRLRGRGAGYYPAKLAGVYQAAQNMATNHLNQFCNCIPAALREELCSLRGGRHDSATGGGKQYWANKCNEIGLVEFQEGVYFQSTLPYVAAAFSNVAQST